MAQLVEQLIRNQQVRGSSPLVSSKRRLRASFFMLFFRRRLQIPLLKFLQGNGVRKHGNQHHKNDAEKDDERHVVHRPQVQGLDFLGKGRGSKAGYADDDQCCGDEGHPGHRLGFFVAHGEENRHIDVHKENVHGEIEPADGQAFADNKLAAFRQIHTVHNDKGREGSDEKYRERIKVAPPHRVLIFHADHAVEPLRPGIFSRDKGIGHDHEGQSHGEDHGEKRKVHKVSKAYGKQDEKCNGLPSNIRANAQKIHFAGFKHLHHLDGKTS